jgi:transcriptional regulator PpsR
MSKRRPSAHKSLVSSEVASRVISSSSDVSFVLDRAGVIREVSLSEPSVEAHPGWNQLIGKRWVDTVTKECQGKVEQVLAEARKGRTVRPREINQQVQGLADVPLRVSGALLDDAGHTVMLARDLRPIAEMQQRLVNAQQALDRDYGRMRQADTRYRVLFHVALEGVLVAELSTRRVLEANPAAAYMLDESPAALQGTALSELFAPTSWPAVQALIAGIEAGARLNDIRVHLRGQTAREANLSGVLFRQSGAALVLLRFWSPEASGAVNGPRSARMLAMLEALPDAVVITSEDRRILAANSAFCELVQQANENQVVGESLERWLGRPGVDLNIMQSNLREHGSVRDFATVVHGDYGPPQEALVTGVALIDGQVPCAAFTIRTVTAPVAAVSQTSILPRSIEQLRTLVGRVPLKELVRESIDLIERLCIEAALDVSGNNRATAAQLLGLSRQGLYSKLRRYGLAEIVPE